MTVHTTAGEFRELFDTVSTWGRPDRDGRPGALRHLTSARRAAAARLVERGPTVGLGRPLVTGARVDVPEPADHHTTDVDVDVGSGPVRFAKDYVGADHHNEGHSHIDALCHVAFDGSLFDGHPAESVTAEGAQAGSIDVLDDGLVGRLDHLQFDDLVAQCEAHGRWEFFSVAAPLRLVGGTGSPLNPIAILRPMLQLRVYGSAESLTAIGEDLEAHGAAPHLAFAQGIRDGQVLLTADIATGSADAVLDLLRQRGLAEDDIRLARLDEATARAVGALAVLGINIAVLVLMGALTLVVQRRLVARGALTGGGRS